MICAYEECKNQFEPKTHNQKYCSDECCKIATNLKIKKKYHDSRDRLSGKARYCKKAGCNSRLSKYNEQDICEACIAENDLNIKKEIWRTLGIGNS